MKLELRLELLWRCNIMMWEETDDTNISAKHGDTVVLKEIFTAKKALHWKTNSTEALIHFFNKSTFKCMYQHTVPHL